MKKGIKVCIVCFLFTMLLVSTVSVEGIVETIEVIRNKVNLNVKRQSVTVNMSESTYVEIIPRLELLSGVLSQTSWIKTRGPESKGNEYYRELKKFFSDYKDHDAIKIAEELTLNGFTYDAPPNYILSLGTLPNLELDGDYSDYLISRAKGENNLERFRLSLIDLAKESNFNEFFKEHRPDNEKYLNNTIKDFNSDKIINWMKDFYGLEGDEFHIVLAPAMFPRGGYGATVVKNDGTKIIYQVVREKGYSITKPQFPKGISLELLTLHEWGHSFVNPSVERQSALIKKFELHKLYKPVEEDMKSIAYGTIDTFFNEQILRAVTATAAEELYGEDAYVKELTTHKEHGFYITEYTIEQLKYYEKHRKKYKTFEDFIPYLFEQYYENQDKLLKIVK